MPKLTSKALPLVVLTFLAYSPLSDAQIEPREKAMVSPQEKIPFRLEGVIFDCNLKQSKLSIVNERGATDLTLRPEIRVVVVERDIAASALKLGDSIGATERASLDTSLSSTTPTAVTPARKYFNGFGSVFSTSPLSFGYTQEQTKFAVSEEPFKITDYLTLTATKTEKIPLFQERPELGPIGGLFAFRQTLTFTVTQPEKMILDRTTDAKGANLSVGQKVVVEGYRLSQATFETESISILEKSR